VIGKTLHFAGLLSRFLLFLRLFHSPYQLSRTSGRS